VDPARFDVTVQSGIVTLSGRPEPTRLASRSLTRCRTSKGWSRSGTGWSIRASIAPASILMIRRPGAVVYWPSRR